MSGRMVSGKPGTSRVCLNCLNYKAMISHEIKAQERRHARSLPTSTTLVDKLKADLAECDCGGAA